jgi:Mrp family chromosome partitioning ATPase
MGRMFRIISEGGHDPRPYPTHAPRGPVGVVVAERPDPVPAEVWEEPAPFVEVGGPDGVVTSHPRPVPDVKPTPVAVAAPVTEPVAPAEPRALSVSFHPVPRAGLRLLPAGVSTDLVAHHFPDHPVSAEYASVRDAIRAQFADAGPRVLGFTTAAAASGTTTVLLNVAASFAKEPGGKVLVVDANLARPGVARRLAVPDAPGLSDVLGQTVPLAWALQPSPVPNLHALSAGTGGVPGGVFAADFPRLLGQLRQWFDWVLVDGGVWGEVPGADAVGPAGDGVLLVARSGEIDRPEFAGLRTAVAAAGGLLRGYVTTG